MRVPIWMDPAKYARSRRNWSGVTIKPAMTKEAAVRQKPMVREALHLYVRDHLERARRGEKGYDPRRLPTTSISKQFGMSKMIISTLAREWRRFLNMPPEGLRGGPRPIPGLKELVLKYWADARKTQETVILIDKLALEAGRQGIVCSTATIRYHVDLLNRGLQSGERPVRLKYGELRRDKTVSEMVAFLQSHGITGMSNRKGARG